MRTTDGLFWPVPVVNLAESCPVEAGQRLALTDPNREGQPLLAVMTVEASRDPLG
jgi:sulfate adenylyltransferase